MSEFYTYCQQRGNSLLYRGYSNGKQVIEKIPFKPTLYVASKKPNPEWNSFYDGSPLDAVKFDSINDAKEFVKTYEGVHGIEIHGFQKYQYQYINQTFKEDVKYNISDLDILTIDLEVVDPLIERGFPDIQTADTPIVTVSLHSTKTNETTILGFKAYTPTPEDNFKFILFKDEVSMLRYLIEYFQRTKPDVITGWNIETFDIPYMVNRITKVLDVSWTNKLSPFGVVNEKNTVLNGKDVLSYDIMGIVQLDYLPLYKKYGTYSAKESYALGFIAQDELGKTKLEMPGTSFRDNYLNHYQIFVQYNAQDSILVKELEEKLKLIELAFAMTYMYKSNVQDVFRTVAPWEIFIFNFLSEQNIAIPPRRKGLSGDVEGAWVMTPKVGMTGWAMTFDFASLYTTIIRQWNISPETFRPAEVDSVVQDWLDNSERARAAVDIARSYNCTVAANGTMYSKEKQGVLPALMEYCTIERKIAKKEMLRLESEYQKTKDASLVPRISALNNRQLALKLAGNSAYGAIGNEGFIFYDYRMAEAITLTGQFSNIHLGKCMSDRYNKILKTENINYVIYGDTDSLFLDCQHLVDTFVPNKTTDEKTQFLDKFADTICQPVINTSVSIVATMMNCSDVIMESKREAIASKCLFRGKKNYAMYVHNSEGVAYNPAKLKVMGIEIVRSNTPQWCRTKLKECLLMIFEKDEKSLQDHFKKIENEFKRLPADVIARPTGVTDIGKHWNATTNKIGTGTIPMHVRSAITYNIAARDINTLEQIGNGSKIKYVYLKLPNPVKQNVIGFPSHMKLPEVFALDKYIDYVLQFDKTFKGPLESLTIPAGWDLEEKNSLESFFA